MKQNSERILEEINLKMKENFDITYNKLKELKELCSNYENVNLIKQKYRITKIEMEQDYDKYKKFDSDFTIAPISLIIYLNTMQNALAKGMKASTDCSDFSKLKESIFIAFDEFDYSKNINDI